MWVDSLRASGSMRKDGPKAVWDTLLGLALHADRAASFPSLSATASREGCSPVSFAPRRGERPPRSSDPLAADGCDRTMCGIAGIIGRIGERNRAALQRMSDAMFHRGPDDRGTWESAPDQRGFGALLGHRRLAILDLSPAG